MNDKSSSTLRIRLSNSEAGARAKNRALACARPSDQLGLARARGIAAKLREAGHDVLALAEETACEGLPDPQVLGLASSEQRILITPNSRDFAPLTRQWAEAGRPHAGIILIWTLDHNQFAEILAGVERQLQQRPSQQQWREITIAF